MVRKTEEVVPTNFLPETLEICLQGFRQRRHSSSESPLPSFSAAVLLGRPRKTA